MTVRVERPAPHVAELVMDRPEARNALSTDQARRLGEAARALAADSEVSVVVLHDVPDAERVHTEISQLLFGTDPSGRPRA